MWTPGYVGPNGVRPRASAARPYNSRLAYVSVSRGHNDAQIYTNDAGKLGEGFSRDVSKQSALETGDGIGGSGQDPRLKGQSTNWWAKCMGTEKGTAWGID